MSKTNIKTSSHQIKRSDPLIMARFIEELSWLLDTYKDIDFKALSYIRNEIMHSKDTASFQVSKHQNTKTTTTLIGTLPGLLTDIKLFPNNESIAEFSLSTLGINIPRWNKKSRNELIGHIVCNTKSANQSGLENVVKALDRLLDGTPAKRKQVEAEVKSGRSWNQVIQSLLID